MGIGQSLRRDVHEAKRPVADEEGNHGKGCRQQQTEGEEGADGAAQSLPVPGADVLGNDDLPGGGEAHGDKEKEGGQLAAVGGGGEARRAHELPHDDHVRHVVDLLQQVCKDEGKREGQKLMKGIPLRQVPDHGILLQCVTASRENT